LILAFMEFELKTNPQVSELAPGIYKALVTTLQGLCVAIPALAIYALLRNRVDELVAQTSLMAEHVFSGFKRSRAGSRRASAPAVQPRPQPGPADPRVEAPGGDPE
jgi:biopolymer transport protein ExbB